MSRSLRIIFAGTPDFSAYHLKILLLSGYKIVGILTQPDRPAGRGYKLVKSSVKIIAEQHQIPIFQPQSLKCIKHQNFISNLNPDVIVVVAYGLILPKIILSIPKLGCINIHASLLPRWRGAAPIQRSLCAGDTITGITIIKMNENLDAGSVIYKLICLITDTDTTNSLSKKLAFLGVQGMLETLKNLVKGTVKYKIQNEDQATYAKKLSKKEGQLNWFLPAIQLDRHIRAFNPKPVCYFYINKKLVKVWKANVLLSSKYIKEGTIICVNKCGIQVATSNGILNIVQLQLEGKKIMSAQDVFNSRHKWLSPGCFL
ncbi:Methionyl-tRNA formyltransferase [Candidatus Ecksteinia adelgidicola]|nr:Methionyl-tRNA formyltransferase [Candidatus Ecksteinia adelgidicola]